MEADLYEIQSTSPNLSDWWDRNTGVNDMRPLFTDSTFVEGASSESLKKANNWIKSRKKIAHRRGIELSSRILFRKSDGKLPMGYEVYVEEK
jgi:hypothetical protein